MADQLVGALRHHDELIVPALDPVAAGLGNPFAGVLLRIGERHLGEPAHHLPVVQKLGEPGRIGPPRSEEHTSELQSLMRISYAVFCLKNKNTTLTPNKQNISYEAK